ncbi:cytidylate kinase [Bacteriovorax sp. BAL6_X]|uniref:(d)CMP kinase n=1 Tax=Bacteriovorax sp. BAL6_X TaxID=1201290 RepID=UPI000385DABF|nr:(d)CMP kinase [Bacteriovorax sp. BAL6_X]EPZ49419.1 cytidylate kinase [Bacteriovorax sp. BAL6_X]
MTYSSVIAIDGPSGSGKSTVAKLLAKELGILYIDTGAMFRALAFAANEKGIDLQNHAAVESFLKEIKLEYGQVDALVKVDGVDLSQKIREHHVSKLASIISQIPVVRTMLLDFQRSIANEKVCVMEGRDIGTIVFPNAFTKFFVTASIDIRAQRRYDQLMEKGQHDIDLEQLKRDVKKRDEKDMGREVAPLVKAFDATLVDTSEMDIDKVISTLKENVKIRAKEVGIEL